MEGGENGPRMIELKASVDAWVKDCGSWMSFNGLFLIICLVPIETVNRDDSKGVWRLVY